MSVFEKLKNMEKEGLGEFIRMVYNIGWHHGAHGIDDELFYGVHLLEQDESVLEGLE